MIAQYSEGMGRVLLLLCFLALRAGAIEFPAKLIPWKEEIEKTSGKPVLLAEVRYSEDGLTMSLPDGTPKAELFGAYLSREDFARQFQRMYAAMINHKKPGEESFLVLVNGRRLPEIAGYEEAVLSHELGHAWVLAQQYASAVFLPGLSGCLAIQTGEVVQHALIRKEQERRGIDYVPFWLNSLDKAVDGLETGVRPSESDRCLRVQQAAELANVRLGLEGVRWPGRERYEAAVKKVFPEVGQTVAKIVEFMRKTDVADKAKHRQAIERVFFLLRDLAQFKSKEYIL